MCIALPGKVTKIEGMKVTVEYPKESREVMGGGISLEVGDYVLVQMGIAVKKLSNEEAKAALSAWE